MGAASCAAAIVLLIDVSGSVPDPHYHAQRDGTAAAFEHPQVIRAIEASGGIAVTVAEFGFQVVTRVEWTIIRDALESRRFARTMRELGRVDRGSLTAVGYAIEFGRIALQSAPCIASERVIDISTDGDETASRIPARVARDFAASEGISINAIAFSAHDSVTDDPGVVSELVRAGNWLRENVATGFTWLAAEPGGYKEAFRSKLTLEIAWVTSK